MARVRFHSKGTHLELSGAEPFIWRQLKLLAPFLGTVDDHVILEQSSPKETTEEGTSVGTAPAESAPESGASLVFAPPEREAAEVPVGPLGEFIQSVRREAGDGQADAALLFTYFLQEDLGRPGVTLSDLLQCCIKVGVDSRNFHHALKVLQQRGLLERVGDTALYRLLPSGITAVEERIA